MKGSICSCLAALAVSFWGSGVVAAELEVVSMHPMMTDLARQVGGSRVSVTGLMRAGDDIHRFSPSSSDMAKASAADVLLLSGKGLELYLPKLRASLPTSARIVEVGNAVRSIKVSSSSSLFVCCPTHAAGSIDPHWWHSIKGMKSSAVYVAKQFGKADPAGAAEYKANAAAYNKRLDALSAWAKREISKVSRTNRVLVTAHAAFGYFCKEFGFKSIPIAGLSEDNVSSKYLAEAIEQIKKHKVKTIFPEENASPKALKTIVSATGVKMGGVLIADASAKGVTSYEAFIRHNISAVVAALSQ